MQKAKEFLDLPLGSITRFGVTIVEVTVGSLLGPYRLQSPIGEGGMGVVYRAVHQKTQRIVALKTVRIPHERMLRSIRQEVSALAKILHPGVVHILEHGVSKEGFPWYAMELVEGKILPQWRADLLGQANTAKGDLPSKAVAQSFSSHRQAVSSLSEEVTSVLTPHHVQGAKSEQRESALIHSDLKEDFVSKNLLPEEKLPEVLTLISYLCHTLAYLHGNGLLHLDLKPQNILVRSAKTPVLVDFGLARRVGQQREKLVFEAKVAGTLAYIAPEQIQQKPLDARADLYALGVLFFELLVGHHPFSATTPMSWVSAHLLKTPPRASEYLSFLPQELDDLLFRLLAKEPQERPGYAEDVARCLAQFGATPPTLPPSRPYLYRPRFWGRDTLQNELRDWSKKIQQGNTKQPVVLLTGESGIGKTRLVMKLAKHWLKAKQLILTGECQDTPEPIPFGVFRKPLRTLADHCRENGEKEVERIFGKRGTVLAQYAPFLANLPGQSQYPEPEPLPWDIAKLRVYRFLEESLLAYAHRKSLLLLLDDLQWADELSLGFLRFLSKGKLSKIGALATFRLEETHETLQTLRTQKEVREVKVGKLTLEEITQMIGDILSLSPPPVVFSRFLYQQSSGNPFFIVEYLRAAVDEGLLWRDTKGRWQVDTPSEEQGEESDYHKLGLPHSLQALVERWLLRLSPSGRRLLEVAALIGREVPWGVLERAAQEDYSSLSELLGRQALEERGGNQLRFIHDQLRERTLAQIQLAQKPVLHRRVATALEEELGSQGREALLGFHWEQANEVEKAKHYYLKGARDAARTYRFTEAERLYQAYLSLETLPCAARLSALLELGEDVLHARAKNEEALLVFGKAIGEAKGLEDKQNTLLGLLRQGDVYQELGEMDAAHQALTKALSLAKESKERGLILGSLANLYRDQSKNEAAIPLYQEALEIMKENKDRKREGSLLGNLASLYRRQSNHEEAIRCYQEALIILRETKSRREEGIVLRNLAILLHAQSKYEEGMLLYEEALQIARDIGNRREEGNLLGSIANRYREQNKPKEALLLYQEALQIARDIGNRRGEGILLGNLANLYEQQNKPKEAISLYQEALQICREIGNRRSMGILLGNLGIAEQNLGHWKSAERLFQEAFQIAHEINDFLSQSFSLSNLAFLYQIQGKSKKSRQMAHESLRLTRETENRQLEGVLLGTLLPVLLYEAGQVKEGEEALEKGLMIFRELGGEKNQGMSFALQAHMTRRCHGDFAKSKTLFTKAEQILLGERKDLRQAAKLFLLRGHLELALGKSASFDLDQAREVFEELHISEKTELGRMLDSLDRADKAFRAKEHDKLFRGELWEEIPSGLRRWLSSQTDTTLP